MQKHLWTDGTDTVVSEDLESIEDIMHDLMGEDPNFEPDDWEMVSDQKPYTIEFDGWEGKPDTGGLTKIPPGATIKDRAQYDIGYRFEVTATAGEWAAANDPMVICSTEW